MATIVTCQCGSKVRLPEQSGNRGFRCPVCKVGIALTADARVLRSAQLQPGEPGAVCPICQSPIAAEEFVVTCPKCGQIHHRECWSEVGGCGTYGCEQAPTVEKKGEAETPLSAWGDTKDCPVCGEKIKAIAVRCRYCGTDFDSVDPLSLRDVLRKERRSEKAKGLQKTVIALFALSLIGCLAPLIAVVSLCILLPRRRELAQAGPVYLVLGYSSIGLSVVYSILMLLFGLAQIGS